MNSNKIKDIPIEKLKSIRAKWNEMDKYITETPRDSWNLEFEWDDISDGFHNYYYPIDGATLTVSADDETGEYFLNDYILIDVPGDNPYDINEVLSEDILFCELDWLIDDLERGCA